MKRRLMAFEKSGGGLPSSYTAVDYLQSSGEQWIEMGVAPNQNTKAVLKIKIDELTRQGASLIGSRTDVNSDDKFITYLDDYGGTRFLFRMDGQPEAIPWKGLTTDKIYIVTLSGTEMKAELEDGTAVFSKTFSVSDFTSTATMALFRSKGVSGAYFQGRIYSCKHYSGDELIQDFVPCLDTGGVPCMFDLVSRKSFYNKGTGSFTWG
ncbi:MAG: hypothetical protein SO436_04650 [Oscillospiraceae bacterium]|nr:hypothetical protein [Oscillospiraceae bacterium]MDD6983447.1 hypothetical protein [Oscillospiraceae bacterium]MDY4623756.1 hypothetical protein [Oscillospiraceae bacterium]